jgi:hypothetical protein
MRSPIESVGDGARPTTFSAGLALAFAVSAALLGATTVLSLLLGAAGVLVVAGGLSLGARRLLLLGDATVLSGVLVSGLLGASPLVLLTCVTLTALVWDVGEQAIGLGEQLGSEADTLRGEVVHASASVLVATVGGGVGYVVFLVSTGGQPLTAVVVLLLAVVVLASALREGARRRSSAD